MKMNKKGESISMSVIIIAAIALLVLVILAVLVLRSGTNVGRGTSCEGVGGQCLPEGDPESDEGICGNANLQRDFTRSGKLGGCGESTPVCCVRVARDTE